MITFDADPRSYKHWSLDVTGEVATLTLDVKEDGGLKPGYALKLNSYDLGVDIELNDALNRIRFEHPTVKVVVLTSGKDRVFCSGANIYMLGTSSHQWKVNFCKFTNETRCGMEDSSEHEGLKFLAAVNGACAGGGYELALACDEILMVDDRSSTVSLPEVPLLAVLPGTGGLTRVVDKRKVRRDRADIFCTKSEGLRADRARDWNLVDHIATSNHFPALIEERTRALAAQSTRPGAAEGVRLAPIEREATEERLAYSTFEITLDPATRSANWMLRAPDGAVADTPDAILAAGTDWWPLAFARELDDAILMLRTNYTAYGLWVFRAQGEAQAVLAADEAVARNADHWLVRETVGLLRRAFRRLDMSSRSLFAVIDTDSCFAGTLFEFVLAADRSYMLDDTLDVDSTPTVTLTEAHRLYPMSNGLDRLESRFLGDAGALEAARGLYGRPLDAKEAEAAGLVTIASDDLDWEDEVRVAIEERASLSPDALTGMEANLRFAGPETPETKVYGRLTAWQNWVFSRPNAVGDAGGLKTYGTGKRAEYDWERV